MIIFQIRIHGHCPSFQFKLSFWGDLLPNIICLKCHTSLSCVIDSKSSVYVIVFLKGLLLGPFYTLGTPHLSEMSKDNVHKLSRLFYTIL